MKRITILFILLIAPLFVLVFCKDKPPKPRPCDAPECYYPRQKEYSWRYINLTKGCTASTIADSFDLTILGANTRHGDVGYDRFPDTDTNSITFIFKKADTLFAEQVGQTVPFYKILVGPIKAGTCWTDSYFQYWIQAFENVTLEINGETYKNCAKIMKKYQNPTKTNTVYEWWTTQYGLVKEMEVDTSGNCQSAEELRSFSTGDVYP
jgi:hypothetical protein